MAHGQSSFSGGSGARQTGIYSFPSSLGHGLMPGWKGEGRGKKEKNLISVLEYMWSGREKQYTHDNLIFV